jgi:hypothetical protein
MGQAPLGKRVGREPLVKHRDRGGEALVVEIRVELCQVLWHHHALVDERRGGQAWHVEHRVGLFEGLLGPAAREEQLAVQRCFIDIHAAVDEDLLDPRQGLQRLFPAGVRIRRDQAPAGHLQLLPFELLLQFRAGAVSLGRAWIEKYAADCKA